MFLSVPYFIIRSLYILSTFNIEKKKKERVHLEKYHIRERNLSSEISTKPRTESYQIEYRDDRGYNITRSETLLSTYYAPGTF